MTEAQKPLAMIVEDDEKLAVIFNQALKLADFDTILVKDGQEALDRLCEVRPAIVVLDLHLPGMPGDKVLQAIRADADLQKMLVIVTTADPAMSATLQDEADLVLIKPVSFSQLRDLAGRLRKTLPKE
jgi:DNA-binding response OmpR family regulator